MIGLVEDVRRVIQPGFKKVGEVIALLGTTNDDLSISEYAAVVEAATTDEMIASGLVPRLDLQVEASVQSACLEAAEAGLLSSAHDCSDGGMTVALAENCFSSLNRESIGADISLTGDLSSAAALFSESPSRIIISFPQSSHAQVQAIAERANCPFNVIGKVGGSRLRIRLGDDEVVSIEVGELENVWRSSLSRRLEAEVMAAGKE
jgi:phosphoribosylformylglycinamidine synthase